MSAPDLPPPIVHAATPRPTAAHLTVTQTDRAELRGSVVVMIDALRASATIAAALHAGATRILPTLTIDEAISRAEAQPAGAILGGERGGVKSEGFDFGNSPREYTPDRLRGRELVFTTTNGTATLLYAARAGAAEILVGSFVNLTAVCEHIFDDLRPVHVLCAGTRDRVTLDDCLAAGAIIERLLQAGRTLSADDPSRLCLAAWRDAKEDLLAAMLDSRGGRNLAAIGLQKDVADCCRIDDYPVVPRFDPAAGTITRADR